LDRINTFSITPEEKTEIRNLFKVVSLGGNPYGYTELKDIFPKYKTLFSIFEICIDVRYGNFLHFPFSGGALEQPVKTMEMLKYIQVLYRQRIAEEEKKNKIRY
jgi:hypothetical protein